MYYIYPMLSMLGKITADHNLKYFFHIFPRKQDLTFHANCLLRRQFAWNVKSDFLGKIEKMSSYRCLLNLLKADWLVSTLSAIQRNYQKINSVMFAFKHILSILHGIAWSRFLWVPTKYVHYNNFRWLSGAKLYSPINTCFMLSIMLKVKKYGEWGEAAGTYITYNYTYKGLKNGKFWV